MKDNMKRNEKMEMLRFAITINLIIGLYNIFLFSYDKSIFNFMIGSLNIGVWVFFRDMKLIKAMVKKDK
ncbi:MAG: hypothetical protein CMG61_06690 [Candidatus Marinimicrobia bacterium]|nr:hypothetical protein [Candidatus Neomarinimicrobiota bacterium]|tara:strand:- start:15996 stop:16202 length:207 start_codon:yes stop_codon:yes gene_type:complete